MVACQSSLIGESARILSSSKINYLQKNFKIIKNTVMESKGKNNTIVIIQW